MTNLEIFVCLLTVAVDKRNLKDGSKKVRIPDMKEGKFYCCFLIRFCLFIKALLFTFF